MTRTVRRMSQFATWLARGDHPRPQLQREHWRSLDDVWEFAFDDQARWSRPGSVVFDRKILLADDRYAVTKPEVVRRIAFADPGIDNYRNQLLWSPAHPTLIDAVIELWPGDRRIDTVWSYTALLVVHQAPTRGPLPHAHVHVHVEIYPWLRMPDRVKYLAASEIGAGVFTADTLPEDKARELRAVEVP